MDLTVDEIIQILKLIEESHFDELHLEIGDLKLIVGKGAHRIVSVGESLPKAPGHSVDSKTILPETSKEEVGDEIEKSEIRETVVRENAVIEEEGLLSIKAPLLGIFYRRPEPGAPLYVEVGTFVGENDTVCLIEVMKVFNTVKAGVRGYIRKVCAESGEMVEYEQTLFQVEPDKGQKKNET